MTVFRSPRAHAAVLAAALLALVGHFAMTLLFLTPPNPLRMALQDTVNGYMTPWFGQRWELFAQPVQHSRVLLIACQSAGEAVPVEPHWYDVTAPLLDGKYTYRLTPADRLHRAVQAATSQVFREHRPLVDKMRSKPEVFADDLARIDDQDVKRSELGRRLVARIASAECDRLHGPGRTIAVKARILLVSPPAFSHRTAPDRDGKATIVDLPWQSHQTVAAL